MSLYTIDTAPSPVSFHPKSLPSISAQSSGRPHQRHPFRFYYWSMCPLEHSKVSKSLPFGFRVTLSLPQNDLAVPEAWNCSEVAVPMFYQYYRLNASNKAFAKSDEFIRITFVSASERPMRLTLPYQPVRWSMTAHCILQSERWMMLKPIA